MRSDEETEKAVNTYADTVYRICAVYLKERSDAEDVFQNVFIKHALSTVIFKDREHEKAWLIRVTINECKDMLKSSARRMNVPLEDIKELPAKTDDAGDYVLEAVRALPQKYRDAVYLHYYEGYTAPEIAKMMHTRVNTVYTRLARAREALRESLGDDIE